MAANTVENFERESRVHAYNMEQGYYDRYNDEELDILSNGDTPESFADFGDDLYPERQDPISFMF